MQNKKLKIIQVGVSGWGVTWLERVLASRLWELVAIVDINAEALNAAVERHGLDRKRVFSSLRDAAKAVEADAALVIVPPPAHLPVALEGLEAGLHLLIEKPLADTMQNAHKLLQAAQASDKIVMISQNYRYRRAAQVVTRIMKQGWLGKLGFANITFRKELYFSKPPVTHGYAREEFIRDCVIHHADQIRGLLQCEAKKVYAHAPNPSWSWYKEPPMLNAIIELEGGGSVEYFGCWAARGTQTTFDGDWYIECEKGQIDFRNNTVLVHPEETFLTIQMDGFRERNGWLEADIPSDTLEDRSYSLHEFGLCILENREPPSSVADNIKSIALLFALRDSARQGVPKEIAEYLNPA